MITFRLDSAQGVLYLHPDGPLAASDFEALSAPVDAYIESSGDLAGVVIEATSFPGWDSFAALAAHIRFVRDHHRHIRRIAVVTDSELGDFAERLGSHFIAAKIRHFPAGAIEAARQWVVE